MLSPYNVSDVDYSNVIQLWAYSANDNSLIQGSYKGFQNNSQNNSNDNTTLNCPSNNCLA